MANVVARMNRPALVISHNKTLAAQLYAEFKEFFPENAVEYFVSYYDYYQPEAYIPQTDTYIEKDSSVNDEIEKLRISAAGSLVSRRDVIVIATVSCIYGLGSPDDFRKMMVPLRPGLAMRRGELVEKMADIHYSRNDTAFERGHFRVRGDVVDVFPAYLDTALRIEFFGDEIDALKKIDPVTGTPQGRLDRFDLYPASGFVTPKESIAAAIPNIRAELEERVAEFERQNKLIEAQRIRMRTEQDIDMLAETGFCTGIENYSRHLAGRPAGSRRGACSTSFRKTRSYSSTKATSPARKSGACTTATGRAKNGLSNTVSGCRARSTTGRCARTNSTPSPGRRYSYPPPRRPSSSP